LFCKPKKVSIGNTGVLKILLKKLALVNGLKGFLKVCSFLTL